MSSPEAVTLDFAAPSYHLFLSPHYDDIALSVGATVRRLADLGRLPQTLIVFGSEPDPAQPLSPFAESLHDEWGFTANEVVSRRQNEERAASGILGSTMRVLPFRDAIYRGHHYLSDDDLFAVPVPSEREMPAQIAAALDLPERPTPDVRLYAPLAIGKHVDHQLVHLAGTHLAAQGWDVWFYEDIPYSLKPGAHERRLAEVSSTGQFVPAVSISASPTWEAKIEAIMCYPSQLETVFRQYVGVGTSRDEISTALGAYARGASKNDVAERFWELRDVPSRAGC